MTITAEQFSFPTKIFRGPDALHSLGIFCKTQGERAFILGGKTALVKTKETINTSLSQYGVEVVATEWYGGECTQKGIQQLTAEAIKAKADVIIAVGGGKALDTGKAVAAACKLPLITVPTIAATCAAVTPLSVIYNEKGEFEGNHFLKECPAGSVVDTTIIFEAPVKAVCRYR
jgi:glycerol dehydrogenase-like iron-containing ADH family enzyme